MTIAYLAGPMRGYPLSNFPAFDEAARRLRVGQWDVISPAEHDREIGFDENDPTALDGFDLGGALLWDLQQIATRADVVVLLPGWDRSAGVAAELALARAINLRVYTYHEQGRACRLELLGSTTSEPATAAEVRVIDPDTGGAKGSKRAQLGAVDPASLLVLAEVAGMGSNKYERYNFLRGYRWSLSFDAMMRHALQFWTGEDTDAESGLPHMAHAAWHGLALVSFLARQLGTDDRPPK